MIWKHVTVAAVAAALVATAAPSSADTVRRKDPLGDAPASIDIASATYTHADQHLRVVARIPDLGSRGTAALSLSKFGIFEAGYVVQIRKRPGQPPRTRLLFFDHFDLRPRACDDLTGTWRRQTVTLAVARSCLTGHAQRRMFAQFGIQRGVEVDRAPAVTRLRRG
ncbi:hypothetical protein GON03_22375 [Nocardioides sp. MAH-18]|uniref:Uncharacterized protein n=1 Tax=Nocardioides agri TaxID=2682843 RepID=A0A6L6XZU5_9ACTN|nr:MULTISPECIES: hypothetical protein [unclassified Nocardioides]MBA2952774.1 hypothetical protein [Nocardioides sp. CGMCC 1.13656]MVQ51936.1 hypothetical protein [Nocardioides sp. MAH-18]